MRTPHRALGERKAHREFEKAKRAADATSMVFGVILPDGRPTYCVMPRTATDDELDVKAFEIHHGRRPETGELMMMRFVKARQAK